MSEERPGLDAGDSDDLELDDDIGLDEDAEDAEPEGEGEALEGDGEPELEAEPEPEPKPRQSREERRIQALRKRDRENRAEIKRLREVQEQALTQTRQSAPQPDPYRQAELQRQEDERVALMTPAEVARHYANQAEQRFQQQLTRQNIEMADRVDRLNFDNYASSRPAAQRMSAEVERTLAEARQAGMNPTRQAVYHLLLGRQVDERASRQIAQQRRTGQRRIASQRTTAGTPRSNAPPQARGRRGGDDSDEAMVARLKSVTLADW